MSIYGLYSGIDGQSHLVELGIVGSGPALDKLLPCHGWRPFQSDRVQVQARHPTPVAGMTVMLDGCMEIGVGGGSIHSVALRPGDMLLVLDTRGKGHSTSIRGPEPLRVAGVSFSAEDWPTIARHFSGWPDDLLAP